MSKSNYDFNISNLGKAAIPSPIPFSTQYGDSIANYVHDDEKIVFQVDLARGRPDSIEGLGLLERAGPREKIYFNPQHVHVAIVTCGGLCPGINDVIRAMVRTLWYRYNCRRISGIRYGYHGFFPESTHAPMELSPAAVAEIHRIGGSILASSRGGGERTGDIVDGIERMNINVLFVIGGDGSQKGALHIAEEIERRGLKIAVVGIPKTIDNDINYIQRTFGFETAVAKATDAVLSAHVEASSVENGIGLVKVMGRDSGFIAAHTAIASHSVHLALVPEVPFDLEGENGIFSVIQQRLQVRGNLVVVVAEGAGQDLLQREAEAASEGGSGAAETDASGNAVLGDIGLFLRKRIPEHFRNHGKKVNLKYINPSYIVRGAVATPGDSIYCSRLATNAVHAAMAGKTKLLISLINNTFVHLPIALAVEQRNKIDPESSLWRDVIEATGQPLRMNNHGESCRLDVGKDSKNPKGGHINAGSNS